MKMVIGGKSMNKFIEYIDQAVERLQREEKMLAATDRKDESNLVKIRINVYGICKSIYRVFAQSKLGDSLKSAYLDKLDSLAVGWQESKNKAQEFNAVDKMIIEDIKLQTLANVRLEFLKFGEDRTC
jgi:hypothetical protein